MKKGDHAVIYESKSYVKEFKKYDDYNILIFYQNG